MSQKIYYLLVESERISVLTLKESDESEQKLPHVAQSQESNPGG